MLELPDVTLCCVDTRTVQLARHAIERCIDNVQFGDLIFLGPPTTQKQKQMPDCVRWIDTKPLKNIQDYNRIVLLELTQHLRTSHLLIVQWDGYITHPELWSQDFLKVDYIGPPWYHGGHPGKVGNGGFSLRSKRLLEALSSMHNLNFHEPEDMLICESRRAELETAHSIKFAPVEMAQAFGCEYGDYRKSFGFHGLHNFANFMSADDLRQWLSNAPPEIIKSKHARKLIKELIQKKRAPEARELIKRRISLNDSRLDGSILYLRSIFH